jgi:CBS-domain-containing membrane protein
MAGVSSLRLMKAGVVQRQVEVCLDRMRTLLDDAHQLMAQHELDRVLVTEEGDRLVGIISEADVRADEGPLA